MRTTLGTAVVIIGAAALWCRPAAAVDPVRACAQAAEEAQQLMAGAKLRAARERLVTCSQQQCPPLITKDCVKWLEEVDRNMPSVVIDAHDTSGHDVLGVRVLADGAVITSSFDGTALNVDPGPHVFRFEARGAPPVEERVMIREGEKNRVLAVTFESPPAVAPPPKPAEPNPAPPEPTRGAPVLAYLFGGVAVVALGAFSYFGIKGISDRSSLESTCKPSCAQSDIDAVHTKFLVADVALAAGVVSAGASAYLFWSWSKKKSDLGVRLRPTPWGGGIDLEGAF